MDRRTVLAGIAGTALAVAGTGTAAAGHDDCECIAQCCSDCCDTCRKCECTDPFC